MYQKYHTDALVLGSREVGEADRALALYTRDFGLVWARATGVRKESSKMRYALQSYARANVSLVRGKHGWRAAGASCQGIALMDAAGLAVFARIAQLVVRLVAGEERNEYLFDALVEAHTSLGSADADMLPTIEIVCVARVLYALGYLSAEALQTALFSHTAYGIDHLREAETVRDDLLLSINRALSETHL